MFMCVKQDNLLDLCELFPETKRNLLQIALERRRKFMVYKRLNSVKYWDSQGKCPKEFIKETGSKKFSEYIKRLHQ